MRLIISPAKKMKEDMDIFNYANLPYFIKDTERLKNILYNLSYEEAKQIWKCNDKIAALNYERFKRMELNKRLTPALFSYEGIQYQYMAPGVFQTEELKYIEEHLRILSGFYGVLRPFDGVVPYRLEMQAKLQGEGFDSLYEYWGRKLAEQLFSESDTILNLASKEYSKCITKYMNSNIRFITCIFGDWVEGKVVEKGTQVKMARGEMVRYMAENRIKFIEEIKSFKRLDYKYAEELSKEDTYVFVKGEC